MCFDAVAAFGQAPETELIFIESTEQLWDSMCCGNV